MARWTVSCCWWLGGVLLALLVGGCLSHSPNEFAACEVRVRNRSPVSILEVVVDAEGGQSNFGFLSSGGKGAVAAGCCIRYATPFLMSWEEEGRPHTAELDMMAYWPRHHEIRRLDFVYLGRDVWNVEARAGGEATSAIVNPSRSGK